MELSRIGEIIGKPPSTVYDWKKKLEKNINFFEHQTKNLEKKLTPKQGN